MKTLSIMIAGVGGQGTVLTSKLIATAAMKIGLNARTTEFIGMAQRGGCVFGHTRIGGEPASPIIPLAGADVLLAFEPSEAVRQLHFLAEGGKLITFDTPVFPLGQPYDVAPVLTYLRDTVPGAAVLDGSEVKSKYPKALNVALLGAAVQSGVFPFDAEALKSSLPELLPERFVEMNLKAFELGGKVYEATH